MSINYLELRFQDGSVAEVYPRTDPQGKPDPIIHLWPAPDKDIEGLRERVETILAKHFAPAKEEQDRDAEEKEKTNRLADTTES